METKLNGYIGKNYIDGFMGANLLFQKYQILEDKYYSKIFNAIARKIDEDIMNSLPFGYGVFDDK